MLDGVASERAGTPAAVVVTDEFVSTAHIALANNGASDMPLVVVDHPINILTGDELTKLAGKAADRIVRVVTNTDYCTEG